MGSGSAAISVVIPTYNEETVIGGLLENLAALAPDEVVVADGSSTEHTAEIAARYPQVLRLPACRATQMNEGARPSSGDGLLVLHAGVRLSLGTLAAVRECQRDAS